MRWLSTLAASSALLLLSRWSLRVARPAEDFAALSRLTWRVRSWFTAKWSIFWRFYGPVTEEMRSRWETLRTRYQSGSFGVEGT